MIDFTNVSEKLNGYKGSEKKKTLLFNNKKHLVKFPDPVQDKNKNISYINNAYSEYIGSNVFRICGFKTQNTILGTYNFKNKEKIVCACENFTSETYSLYEFESLALSSNPDKKIGTELTDIMEVIKDSENIIDTNNTKEIFWDMFIVDALIGNTDRHNGNWGFLLNNKTKEISFAPIYDCGSCLNPMLEDKQIEEMSKVEIKNLAINSYSCLKENGKKINYMSYIRSKKHEECNEALLRIFDKINIEKIIEFIDSIPCMSVARKNFYKQIIEIRYEILKNTKNVLSKK